ncbi:MAG: hypothetical protein ABR929_09285 [Roseiarcus sp.]|jgi:hypothetical protein
MLALRDPVSPWPADAPAPEGGPWAEPAPSRAPRLAETDGEPLAVLAGQILEPRFRSWRGASGRRYIVSVYDPDACPAYCDAVLIAAAVDPDGRRRLLALADTGVFPEPVLARAKRSLGDIAEPVEFHLHLLAASSAERRVALDDLAAACPYAARN